MPKLLEVLEGLIIIASIALQLRLLGQRYCRFTHPGGVEDALACDARHLFRGIQE
jgi:hypothetical protein